MLSLRSYHSSKPSFETATDEEKKKMGVLHLYSLSLCNCMEEKFRCEGRESRM